MTMDPTASTSASADDGSSDGYDTVCDGDGVDECRRDCPVADSTPWNSWEALPSSLSTSGAAADVQGGGVEEAGGHGGLNSAIDCAIKKLMDAQALMASLRDQFDCDGESSEDDDDSSCVIGGDPRLAQVDHLNQSACNAGTVNCNYCADAGKDVTGEAAAAAAAAEEDEQSSEQSLHPWLAGDRELQQHQSDDLAGNWEDSEEHRGQPLPHQQKLTTCEEDVIGQRLSSCLKLLQGGPYQECDLCVRTLSSCDQNHLASRDMVDRLSNLEMLLLYLQVRYRSQMSCGQLKQLCQLKKAIGCMHGFLLRRQSNELLSKVGRLHERLDRTGDIRRHWRAVPPVSEKFRFVVDKADCVPRVLAEDEWLRGYLPASERASLGYILASSDPTVDEQLGRRMAFTKGRGRSTRLHNGYMRDSYEDLLRHFQFALS